MRFAPKEFTPSGLRNLKFKILYTAGHVCCNKYVRWAKFLWIFWPVFNYGAAKRMIILYTF
jgi:hypothetical protein